MYSQEELHRRTDSLQKRKFRQIYMLNFLGAKINFSWACVNKHDFHLDLGFLGFLLTYGWQPIDKFSQH